MKYNLKFICKKFIDLMQKMHDKNTQTMNSFLNTVKECEEAKEEDFAYAPFLNETRITEKYDEDFDDEPFADEESIFVLTNLKGHERAIFEYVRDQIQNYRSRLQDEKFSVINIFSSELQKALNLKADQISRALWKLVQKNVLSKRGYFADGKYCYEIVVPCNLLQ